MWKGFMHNTINSVNSRSLSRNNMKCNKSHINLAIHKTPSVVSINICSNCSRSNDIDRGNNNVIELVLIVTVMKNSNKESINDCLTVVELVVSI